MQTIRLSTYLISFFFFFLLSTNVSSQQFELTENCRQAYDEIIKFKLDYAQEIINQEKAENPGNLLPVYLENAMEVLKVFTDEELAKHEIYDDNKDARLEKIKSGDPNSPYYLFLQAELKIHSAAARLKFEQYLTAAWELKQAFSLLNNNQKKFPNFNPTKKSLGYLHALIGTVPDKYKWLLKIVGLSGTIEQGMGEIEEFIQESKNNGTPYFKEAQPIFIFFLIYLDNQYDRAYSLMNNELDAENSLYDNYVTSSVAFRLNHLDEAINYLESRPKGPEYYPVPYFDYLLGTYKLFSLDLSAKKEIKYFVDNFNGLHYVKDAYQKLGWISLIEGDEESYRYYLNKCKNNGAEFIDNDINAHQEAVSGKMPNVNLLKTRLLFDGGYFQESLDNLFKIDYESLSSMEERLEYIYRIARGNEGLENFDTAIDFFNQTIEMDGGNTSFYFAAKSCQQMGIIHERKKMYEQARYYFRKAMTYPTHNYKNSVDQQSKAGLNRLKGK